MLLLIWLCLLMCCVQLCAVKKEIEEAVMLSRHIGQLAVSRSSQTTNARFSSSQRNTKHKIQEIQNTKFKKYKTTKFKKYKTKTQEILNQNIQKILNSKVKIYPEKIRKYKLPIQGTLANW